MELIDQVVLVPGATRPVGRAIARLFAENGATLVLPCFTDWPDSTEEMKEEFTSAGYRYYCHTCDLTNKEEVSSLISHVNSHYGKLHILINNIERGGMPIIHGSYDQDANSGQWEIEINTTVTAKWNLFHYGLSLIKSSGGGAVVNISSIAAIIGRTGPASLLYNDGYCAANRAISSFTETWAREGAPDIRVNEVMLGLIKGRHAENTRGWSALSGTQRTDLLNHTLLKRSGNPEEVAEMVYFLAVKARYITGGLFRVDGGFCLGSGDIEPMPPGIINE